ncbi:MAG: twin-arginine translocase subunit TatB [Myxococcales bacterium]|nr:twin-arginine translocase subunit TatB [Myxococcales bacterium]
MFGLGFGEMVVLVIVLLVVVGPKELPKMLRAAGKGLRKLRTMSADLREQSGIDDIIDEEGLREELQTLRTLSRPGAVVGSIVQGSRPRNTPRRPAVRAPDLEDLEKPDAEAPDPAVEWPLVGPDSYGALADDATEEEIAAAKEAAEARRKAEAEAEEARAKAIREREAQAAAAREAAQAESSAQDAKAAEEPVGDEPAGDEAPASNRRPKTSGDADGDAKEQAT